MPLTFLVLFASLAMRVAAPADADVLPFGPSEAAAWQAVDQDSLAVRQNQVRIAQRIVIRIAPQGTVNQVIVRQNADARPRFRERNSGDCLPLAGIEGVRVNSDQRLLLFMRDHRLIGANMDDSCQARHFETGFYVDRSKDGMLCVNRDMLRSRSGASCSMSRLRELVRSDP